MWGSHRRQSQNDSECFIRPLFDNSSCCSHRAQNERRNLESWFTSSHLLLPPNSFWEKTKSKIWEKIMKTEQCRCQPRTEAGISVISLRECERRERGREGRIVLRAQNILKFKDLQRLSNFVFLANLSSAGSSALASSNWICLHWDYLQYNLASLYFSDIFFIEQQLTVSVIFWKPWSDVKSEPESIFRFQ